MPSQYKYDAVTHDGVRKSGLIGAAGTAQVEEFLELNKLIPISISEANEQYNLGLFSFRKKIDYEQLITFTSSLATMYRAGIPLLRALEIIKVGKSDSKFNQVLGQIKIQVQSGRQLSESMEDHPNIFSRVYTASIQAGEESGKLDEILDELSQMLESEHELTRQIKSAVRYPVIVLIAISLAIFVLMSFVIPRFVAFYSSFDAELPLATRVIMNTSEFLSQYWPVVLFGVIALVVGFRKIISTSGGRMWHDRQLLKIPVLGELVIKGNIARFCIMFRILFNAGIPLIKTLTILSNSIKNVAISKEIGELEDIIRQGQEIESSSDLFEFFPEQAIQMISIGMESGNLDKMLREVGRHYSRQVSYMSLHLTSIIEPLLTLILGAFVLVLALAIFLPMWNLIKVFSG